MYLKQLHISNFRCFGDYTIEFAPGVNILFGKNGSGKSTLVHAIHKALSFLMYYEETKERTEKGKKTTVKDVKTFRLRNPYPKVEGYSVNDCSVETTKPIDYEININAHAIFGKTFALDWDMMGVAPKMTLRKSGYRLKFLDLYEWSKNQKSAPQLPLLGYYSDGFPHNTILNQSKSTEKTKRDYHLKNNYPELGFTDWNSEKGFTHVWLDRLAAKLRRKEAIPREDSVTERLLSTGKIEKGTAAKRLADNQNDLLECTNEINKITECLQRFFEGDTNFEVSSLELGITDSTTVCVVTPAFDRRPFNVLPAGYKRLFYIVLDIAYRSLLLSNGRSTDIPGIAIIDEIDLHLHPELEQVVLQRFIKTFPSVQFIVSTHSPAVLSNLPQSNDNRIVQMLHDGNRYGNTELESVYGLDYNNTVSLVMGAQDSDPHTKAVKDRYVRLMRRGKFDKAELAAKEIQRLFPTKYERVFEELKAQIMQS